MTVRREASRPPTIPGLQYVRLLGIGGFADVFLYEQELPRRSVAVKVLLAATLDDEMRRRFRVEADLMARLSHHPSIVTVLHADVADDGRPYLVMEYCAGPSLAERYRAERMPVAEVLRIAIRLACAVETAHRAGILHRDIKPANVLTTDFGWPALTDFGIAATTGAVPGGAVGMSIPWAPAELLSAVPSGDERSDVYSLAATVYSLLAGRTPFEVPGGANGAADLVARIERGALPPVGRVDVPARLDRVLAGAMARDPVDRPTAAALARDLQQVEAGLGLAVTPLDLPDAMRLHAVPRVGSAEGDQATRVRPVVATADPTARRPAPGPSSPPEAAAGDAGAGPIRHVDGPGGSGAPAVPSRRRLVLPSAAGVVLVVAVAAIAATAAGGGTAAPSAPVPASATAGTGVVVSAVPAPVGLAGTMASDGSVRFTWTNPEPLPGDRYLWGVVPPTGEPTLALVDVPTVTVPGPAPVCVEVSIVREDRRASTHPAQGCAR